MQASKKKLYLARNNFGHITGEKNHLNHPSRFLNLSLRYLNIFSGFSFFGECEIYQGVVVLFFRFRSKDNRSSMAK